MRISGAADVKDSKKMTFSFWRSNDNDYKNNDDNDDGNGYHDDNITDGWMINK